MTCPSCSLKCQSSGCECVCHEEKTKIDLSKRCNLIHGDCLEVMKELPDESIDCIWTDPPYNINYKYDEYHDKMELVDYFIWTSNWLKESKRILKKDGNIFIKMWSKHLFSINNILINNGFFFKNIIIWKRKSCANYKDRFLGGYEVILFYSKSVESKFYPEGYLRQTIFLKRWDRSKEYKGRLNDLWDDIKPITAGNLIHAEGCYENGSGKKKHPAQHPKELVDRCILCSTQQSDLILDMFCGSGTSAISSLENGRRYLGIDISKKYINITKDRIKVLGNEV